MDEILDASASIVPFKCSKQLRNYLKKALSTHYINNYPDRTHQGLKEAIGKWHQIDTEMVLPGNGASELLTWAARDASENGISGIPAPGFSDYARALRCWNANFLHIPLPLNWSNKTPQNFPIYPQTNVLWITNPHNPTGQLWSKDSLKVLLEKYNLIICDEAFLPLVPNGEEQSLIPLTKTNKNLIVIRSLTKLLSIPGLRLGYAISSPERLRNWSQLRDPWPLNGLAIATGQKIMSDINGLTSWIKKIEKWVSKEGPWLYSNLKDIPGIYPLPSSTNFLLIKGKSSLINLKEQAEESSILLRDCRSFEGLNNKYLRVSLQERKENKRIVSTIKKIMKTFDQ